MLIIYQGDRSSWGRGVGGMGPGGLSRQGIVSTCPCLQKAPGGEGGAEPALSPPAAPRLYGLPAMAG